MRHRISEIGSERATGGSGNKIVTYDGKTHVVWQDISREGYLNRVRSYCHRTDEWSETVTLNSGVDNHARPVITIDYDSTLHVVLSGHGTPVTSRSSVRPNDSSEWTPEEPAGSGTYPIIVCDWDNTLFLTMRPARPIGADLFIKPPGQPWHRQARLLQRTEKHLGGYAAYPGYIGLGLDGTLHYLGSFYEGLGRTDRRALHQAVCYMRSVDRGVTWQRADGTPVSVPATPEAMDLLCRSEEERHEPMPPPEVACAGIVSTHDNLVLMLCISHRERPGKIVLHSVDRNGRWNQHVIPEVEQAFPQMRPTAAQFGIRNDGSLYALVTLRPLSRGWKQGKPTRDAGERPQNVYVPGKEGSSENGDRSVWLVSDPSRDQFRVLTETEPDTPFNTPTAERPVGANRIAALQLPSYLYFDGSAEYPRGHLDYFKDIPGYIDSGDHITNNVYWVGAREEPPI